ncbi:MAG: hypothetical protein MdMp014T_2929 [Treponematales bacterium]
METATFSLNDAAGKTQDAIGKQREPWMEDASKAKTQRDNFLQSLKVGQLPCLPDETGYANTKAVYNPLRAGNNHLHGIDALMARDFIRIHGFSNNAVLTFEEAKMAAKFCNPDVAKPGAIKEGEHGFTVSRQILREGAFPDADGKYPRDAWKAEHTRLFSVDQMVNPKDAWTYVKQHNITHNRFQSPVAEIVADSSDPEKYLGQYYAACFLGAKFKGYFPGIAPFEHIPIFRIHKFRRGMVKINKRVLRVLPPRPLRELRGGDEGGHELIAYKTAWREVIIEVALFVHGALAPVFAANTVHYDTSPLSDGSLFA